MYNFYSDINLNTHQKLAYLSVIAYILNESPRNDIKANIQMMKFIKEINLSEEEFNLLTIPSNKEELYDALKPITTRPMALYLIHNLWLISTINEIITDREIEIIRQVAEILKIDNDKLLEIHNFVEDELVFLDRAKTLLEMSDI